MEYEALTRIALGYVLEDENWLPFLEWVSNNGQSDSADLWVKSKPSIKRIRQMWIDNSPDPAIRQLKA
jgi:hypothetical protein